MVALADGDLAVSVKVTSRVIVSTIVAFQIAAAQRSQSPKTDFLNPHLLSSSAQVNPPAAARWDSRGPFASAGSATTTAWTAAHATWLRGTSRCAAAWLSTQGSAVSTVSSRRGMNKWVVVASVWLILAPPTRSQTHQRWSRLSFVLFFS